MKYFSLCFGLLFQSLNAQNLPELPPNAPKQILLQLNKFYIYEDGKYQPLPLTRAFNESLVEGILREAPSTHASLNELLKVRKQTKTLVWVGRVAYVVHAISLLGSLGEIIKDYDNPNYKPNLRPWLIGYGISLPTSLYAGVKINKNMYKMEDLRERTVFEYNRAMQNKPLE